MLAYVGPGAGFAVMTSFFTFFVSFLLAFFSILFSPFRFLYRLWIQRRFTGKRLAKRVMIIGFDGMDMELTRQWMEEGKLPNLERLSKLGSFLPLQTTYPAVSPVAWSSFATGANPGKHNIFDFLSRNTQTYLPALYSTEIIPARKTLSLGNYEISLSKPRIISLRKSKAFWKILGEQGIFSAVIRVPVTFPPEKFFGVLLSGMCVPDLLGTQGTFTYFTSDKKIKDHSTGGRVVQVKYENGSYTARIQGPLHSFKRGHPPLEIPLKVEKGNNECIFLSVGKKKYKVPIGKSTEWISLKFPFGFGLSIYGIAQFFINEYQPELKMYMSPINIDPHKPCMPISHPLIFSAYLAHQQGKYATLGLAEDTWALNEGILGERAFIGQVYKNHDERLQMFWSLFDSVREGVITCVFDATDRIQHMFMRYLDPLHPAYSTAVTDDGKKAIEECYQKMDLFVGEVLNKLDKSTILCVMSDHGFKSFRRGFHVNAWLRKEGYLCIKENTPDEEWFANVDWSQTKAYALGLTGLYINQQGREKEGIIAPGTEKELLLSGIKEKLLSVKDSKTSEPVFSNIYRTSEIYNGPYKDNAPDLILGYNNGYRGSWDSVVGKVEGEILEDNLKNWSGDHCIDPPQVPGVFFLNRQINRDSARIIDIAPTVLKIFGVPVPTYMDGNSLL